MACCKFVACLKCHICLLQACHTYACCKCHNTCCKCHILAASVTYMLQVSHTFCKSHIHAASVTCMLQVSHTCCKCNYTTSVICLLRGFHLYYILFSIDLYQGHLICLLWWSTGIQCLFVLLLDSFKHVIIMTRELTVHRCKIRCIQVDENSCQTAKNK